MTNIPPTPSSSQALVKDLAETLSLDGLKNAIAAMQAELDRREGRMKYQPPEFLRLN